MNSAETPTSGNGQQTSARMLALLLVAVVVGRAFNSANPLGVHSATPAAKAATAATSPAAAKKTAGNSKSIYDNQTLSLSLETEGNPTAATGETPAPAPQPTEQFVPGMPKVPTLTWPEAKKLSESGQAILVDARAAVYYQTEHIPGAVSLPAGSPQADVDAFVAKYPKNASLIVYCGSLQCPLSEKLVTQLTGQLGYTNVREMPGGFVEYRQWESAKQPQGGTK